MTTLENGSTCERAGRRQRQASLLGLARRCLVAVAPLLALVPWATHAAVSCDIVGGVCSTSSTTHDKSPVTWQHTVGTGSNRYLVVGVSIRNAGKTVSSITWDGASLELIGAGNNHDGAVRVELWGLKNPASGIDRDIVVTLSGNAKMVGGAASFVGVAQVDPSTLDFAVAGSTGTGSSTPSVTVCPSSPTDCTVEEGDVVASVLASEGDAGTQTPDSPATLMWSEVYGTSGGDVAGAGSAVGPSPVGSVTMSWTMTSPAKWAVGAAVLPAAPSTRAEIGDLSAYRSAVGGSVVRWNTLSEHGTLGFHLLRLNDDTEEYERVNRRLLPGLVHSRHGGHYRVLDLGASPDETHRYKLVEVEATGAERVYGPYRVAVEPEPPSTDDAGLAFESPIAALAANGPVADFERAAAAPATADETRLRAARSAREASARQRRERRGPAVKLGVREAGLYFVGAATIAGKLGKPVSEVTRLIERNALALGNRGKPVATLAAPGSAGLYFYGESVASAYARDNVYWLRVGRGLPMGSRDAGRPAPVSGRTFTATRHVEGNRYSLTHLVSDPDADYWMWDFVYPGWVDTREFAVPSPGVATRAAALATLTVRLHGGSRAEHRATIALGGVEVCRAQWTGLAAHEAVCDVEAALLADGENTVTVTGMPGGVADRPSMFYVNDLVLAYPRRYASADDALALDSAGHRVVSVEGFSAPDIRVFDLADPARPLRVRGVGIDGAPGAYRATFSAPPEGRSFLALTPEAIRTPVSVVADVPSRLEHQSHRVDWLMITTSDLVAAAQGLARHRQGQGLRTLVVDVEDVYDEFGHGIEDPDAIWRFLRHAHTRWRRGPRYVVLGGEGSFDYKDHLGHGDALVPTLLAPTPDGLLPADNLYADVVGNDRIPEMAIGRLPVIDAQELEAVSAKLVAYEHSGGPWARRILLSADAPDAAGDFHADSGRLGTLVPPAGFELETIHVDDATLSPGAAREQMLGALESGKAFVNFYGHSGHLGLGNADLINVFDVPGLRNADRLPVVTAFTCLAGQFGFPGQDSVAEALVLAPNGGAAAVWAPSGLSYHHSARVLGEAFYAATLVARELVIGEAVLAAQRAYAKRGSDAYLLDVYNLIGDPATVMK